MPALGIDWKKLRLFVCFEPGSRLATRMLRVLPHDRLEEALAAVGSEADAVALVSRVYERRLDYGPLPFTAPLTPQHFLVEPEGTDDRPAAEACRRLAVEVALTYLAERTTLAPLEMVFQGYRQGRVEPHPIAVPGTAARDLAELVRWACDERVTDKLPLAQGLISLRLLGDPASNFDAVLAATGEILRSAQSNWKVYLRDSTGRYFEKQRERSDYIATKAQQYSRTLSTTLAGIGGYGLTLLGFFVSNYLLEAAKLDKAERHLVASVFLLYSAIVVAVLFGYTFTDERLLARELKEERKRLGQFFVEDELVDLMDRPIRRRRRQFYGLVGFLCGVSLLVLALLVCHVLRQYGSLW